MMGGEISVESAKGAGAVFTFTVPLTEDKNEGDANAAKWDAFCVNCFEGKVFLLAEDVETNREIFKTLMADSGAEIICAQNGEEAVNIFENSPGGIDLIIMDVQMPRMNGLDATRLLRGNGATVPIIAFTANVFREDIDECISAGMNDHLGKPLDTEEVYRKIGRLLA
jgi:CheY-like chemotaxis protein